MVFMSDVFHPFCFEFSVSQKIRETSTKELKRKTDRRRNRMTKQLNHLKTAKLNILNVHIVLTNIQKHAKVIMLKLN